MDGCDKTAQVKFVPAVFSAPSEGVHDGRHVQPLLHEAREHELRAGRMQLHGDARAQNTLQGNIMMR